MRAAAIPMFVKRIIRMTDGRSFSSPAVIFVLAGAAEVPLAAGAGAAGAGASFPPESHAGVSDMIELDKINFCTKQEKERLFV